MDKISEFKLPLLLFFQISMIIRFISMLFVMNFSTDGLTITASLTLLFPLFGTIIMFADRFEQIYDYLTNPNLPIVVVILNILTLIDHALFTTLISGLNFTLINILLMNYFHENNIGKNSFAEGMAIGFALNLIISSLLIGANVFATLFGHIIFIVLTLLFLVLEYIYRSDYKSNNDAKNMYQILLIQPICVYGTLFVAFPFVVGSWSLDASYISNVESIFQSSFNLTIHSIIISLFGLIGLLISIQWNIKLNKTNYILISVGFIISLIDLIFLSIVPPISYLLNLFTLVELLEYSPSNKKKTKYGLHLFIIQFILVILIFLNTTAGNWAFLPSIMHPIIKGLAAEYLALTGLSFSGLHMYFTGGIYS